MNDPNQITGAVHHVGRFHDQPGWHVFTDYLTADGGACCVADVGPFASQDAAQVCADMATAQGVEDIGADMVRQARRAYLSRVLK